MRKIVFVCLLSLFIVGSYIFAQHNTEETTRSSGDAAQSTDLSEKEDLRLKELVKEEKLKEKLQDILSGRIKPFDGTLEVEDTDRTEMEKQPVNL